MDGQALLNFQDRFAAVHRRQPRRLYVTPTERYNLAQVSPSLYSAFIEQNGMAGAFGGSILRVSTVAERIREWDLAR